MYMLAGFIACTAIILLSLTAQPSELDVIILADRFPGTDSLFVNGLVKDLEAEGLPVCVADGETIKNRLSQTTGKQLLIIPNSAYFPASAKQAVVEFVKRGGNLLTIGGPPFSKQVTKFCGEWLTEDELIKKFTAMPAQQMLLHFGKVRWSVSFRDTGTPEMRVQVRTVPSGIAEAPTAAEIRMESVTLWEFQEVPLQESFPSQDSVAVFWAKALENCRKCIVALIDKGGASWFTDIELSTSWKRYVIPAWRFRHWKGPGGANDRVDLRNVTKFKVGFEYPGLRDPHKPATLWVSDVTCMKNPAGNPDFSQPLFETLSPSYKTYKTTAAELIRTFGSYSGPDGERVFKGPVNVVCSLPRYRGLGFNKQAPQRWIPQLAVRMKEGHIGGAAAALYVQDNEEYSGTVWATLGIEAPVFLKLNRSKIASEVVRTVRRIKEGIFLLSAGTDRASYFDDTPSTGAIVLNLSSEHREARVEISITEDQEYSGYETSTTKQLLTKSVVLTEKRNVVEMGRLANLPPGFYIATTSLYLNDTLVDQVRQPFSIVESKPVSQDELVTIKGDLFYYKGKPWYSLGINYRPVYVASLESKEFWKYWTHPDQYDPEIIEMELDLMNKIGLNTVAIIYPDIDAVVPALVDFMERAHRHGLKCHVYVAGLEPMWPKPEVAEKLIRAARLWERPAMFAYDLGWEVRIGREERRQSADAEWKRWIEDRYGSVENAEQDWQFPLRKEPNGRVHGPTDEQVMRPGPWDRMVAAYRRFWDDKISRQYMKNRQVIKKLDPYHPISVRSGFGGTGTLAPYAVPQMPVDLFSGAKHLDYISPEGYNFSGDMQKFREGGFTTLYGKFVSGGKPIYWAEFGYSVSGNPTAETLEAQREYYEKIYRVFYETRSAGSAAWWWPGYLIWEGSDFAVINPDFTLRPAAYEFTKMARMAKTPYPEKKPNYWIEFDRDEYANGYAGVLADKRVEYGKAVKDGKTVGLRTQATGTDTSNFPRLSIGGAPLNGQNAPKYLNAEFNRIEILDASGKWVRAEDGDRIVVKRNAPVYARASVGNTNEVKWLAEGRSAVYLRASVGEEEVLAPIARDTPFLADGEVPIFKLADGVKDEILVSFQMVTQDIVFGEKRFVVLRGEGNE